MQTVKSFGCFKGFTGNEAANLNITSQVNLFFFFKNKGMYVLDTRQRDLAIFVLIKTKLSGKKMQL